MKPRRRVLYVTGTRADFGLMRSTLTRIANDSRLALEVVATGMHLDAAYGSTVEEITDAGLVLRACVPVDEGVPSGALMAANIGRILTGLVNVFDTSSPDVVLLLGDRGEMLAGAIAALHLNIPTAHIHGGERSGTVDEPVRHAISKMSRIHLVATEGSRHRLVDMGEAEATVHVVGAPGIDGLADLPLPSRTVLGQAYGFDPTRPLALMVFHPVLDEAVNAGAQTETIVTSLLAIGAEIIAFKPNSDAGGFAVRTVLEAHAAAGEVHLFTHLARPEFVALMAAADVMVGNSSSGIIEAGSFGTPVVNIGSRQKLRERNINVTDVSADSMAIEAALVSVLGRGRYPRANIYGNGSAGERIVDILASVDLDALSRGKTNAY